MSLIDLNQMDAAKVIANCALLKRMYANARYLYVNRRTLYVKL